MSGELHALYNDMRREEKSNIERFGDDYRNYMEQVPRMNFVVGTVRLVRGRRGHGNAA